MIAADNPLPPDFVRDRVIPYPRTHARQVTLAGVALAAVVALLLAVIVRQTHPQDSLMRLPVSLAFILAAVALVPVHEGLHVLAALLHEIRLSDIKLGFRRGFITVRFRRSISIGGMRVVLLAPLVLMGLPLLIFSLRTGERQWIVLLAAHVGSTMADIYTYWRLAGLDPEAHILQEPGVHGLTVWRRHPERSVQASTEPLPTLSMHALVGLAAGLLFMVVPFMLPDHGLLSDMVLACRRSDDFVPKGWQGESFDYHVSESGALLLTTQIVRNGVTLRTTHQELALTARSGRLDLLWKTERRGPNLARLVIEVDLAGARTGLLDYEHPTAAQPTSIVVAQKRRVRTDRELRLLYHLVADKGGEISVKMSHVSGRTIQRKGLPPGLEITVGARFLP